MGVYKHLFGVVTFLLVLGSLTVLAEPSIYANFTFLNGTNISQLFYDRADLTVNGLTYGSNSYRDHSYTNNNALLDICHPNLTLNQQVDLVYYSESRNYTASLVNFKPQIVNITTNPDDNSSYCTSIDVDLASTQALYPGYIEPRLINETGNISFDTLYTFLNGSYDIGVFVDVSPIRYFFTIGTIYDHNETPISTNGNYLVTTVLDANNNSLNETVLSPGGQIMYGGSLSGGESVVVNGISSLQIILHDPCDPINETGFYLLNSSGINVNKTCIIVNDTDNVILHFGDELIDGDNLENGSLQNDSCPVTIINSANVTVQNLRTQEFSYGVCIQNSSVTLIGNNSVYHGQGGVLAEENSTVSLVNVLLSNNSQDIIARNGSLVTLTNVEFDTAHIYSTFQDVNVTSVPNAPDPPSNDTFGNITNISQYIQYEANNDESWAVIKFFYTEPIPNGVVANNVSIYEYNGTYGNYTIENTTSVFNATTNTTTNITTNITLEGWFGGNWTQLFTTVSTSEQLIISPNQSNFSVFAPFGEYVPPENVTEPEPDPTPVTAPTSGLGGGGGGSPSRATEDEASANPYALRIRLDIPENVTLKQGEAGIIPFNVTNLGELSAYEVQIVPLVSRRWDYTNYTIDELPPETSVLNTFQVAPYEKATPRDYVVPVVVLVNVNGDILQITQELLVVTVIPRGNLSRIKVLEYPPVIEMAPRSALDVSFLVENIGDYPLNDIYVQFDPSECLDNITGTNSIDLYETKLITYTFTSSSGGTCNYNLKFYQDETLVGFVPVTFVIKKPVWLEEPFKISMLLLVIIIWTLLTMAVVHRRRRIG